MAIFVIADLHLSLDGQKPMDIFGFQWEGHIEKIKENWKKKIKPEDTVILAGDFCWAMQLKETYEDFQFLEKLPGKKILLKGNHDYWWTTLKSMRTYLKENNFTSIDFLYNNSYLVEDKIIVGTRGWSFLGEESTEKILARERQRLVLSLEDGIQKYGADKEKFAFIHYPPLIKNNEGNIRDTRFLQVLKEYDVKACYYGHLHGGAHRDAIEGNVQGVHFQLVSGDYTNFDFVKVV